MSISPVSPEYGPGLRPGQLIDDATVWYVRDYGEDRSWVHRFSGKALEDIDQALATARARGIPAAEIRREDFVLGPAARDLVDRLYADVEHGPGFALVSGFPVERYEAPDLALAYAGFCSHFGTISQQNREGEFLLEVTDKGKGYDRSSRGYHSTAHLDFHNDGTNTVTLLCLETARSGGRSMLVSGPAVYNAFVRERPELLEPLHRGFHHHRRDQREATDAPVTPYRTPVFGFFGGHFHMAYAGPSIRYCAQEGIDISPREIEALDFFESVVARPQMQVSMELRKGDLQLVNNYVCLHARTAYEDGPGRKRRLLRLWLDDTHSRRLGPGKMDWYLPEISRFTLGGGIASLEHRAGLDIMF